MHAFALYRGGTSRPTEKFPAPNPRESGAAMEPDPLWWDRLLALLIDHGGGRFPPLWPLAWIAQALRTASIQRAFQALRKELEFDGSEDFDFVDAFIRIEAERRNDPAFHAACENALRVGRIAIPLLGPVILHREIEGLGQGVFVRRLAWRIGYAKEQILPRPAQ